MKKLLEKVFKKTPTPNFMANVVQSTKINAQKNVNNANYSEYEIEKLAEIDEMQIDRIYESL